MRESHFDRPSQPAVETHEPFAVTEEILAELECARGEVASTLEGINEHTKVYIGELTPGLFEKLPSDFERLFISYPDSEVYIEEMEVGGKTGEELIKEMEAAGIYLPHYTATVLKSAEFTLTQKPKVSRFIELTVSDLGFSEAASVEHIYLVVRDLGLELCAQDTAPYMGLSHNDFSDEANRHTLNVATEFLSWDGDPHIPQLQFAREYRDKPDHWGLDLLPVKTQNLDPSSAILFRLPEKVEKSQGT